MGFKVPTKGEKVHEPSRSAFAPITAGPVLLSIFDAEAKQYGEKTANAGRDFYKLQFKVEGDVKDVDGKNAANRRLFENVGMFASWAPTPKNPDGSDNFTFFNFFAAVTGKKEKDLRDEYKKAVAGEGDFEVPSPSELLGKKVTGIIKIVPDEYAYNQYKAALKSGEITLEDDEKEKTQQDFLKNVVNGYKPADAAPAAGDKKEEAFTL